MDLCDSNVWLALAIEGHPLHAAARAWLESLDRRDAAIFCRATQISFVRLLTNASVLAAVGRPPQSNRAAWRFYESLLSDDRIAFRAEEPTELERCWKELVVRDTASPKLWMDAYLAAFAQAGGYRMVTTDKGFRQFPGVDLLLLGAD